MTVMPDKGISKIRYNHLSLPSQLKMQASIEDITIDNKYRADGVEVTKKNMTITSGIAADDHSKDHGLHGRFPIPDPNIHRFGRWRWRRI